MPKKRRADPYVTGRTMMLLDARLHATLVANNLAAEGSGERGAGDHISLPKDEVQGAIYLAMCRALGVAPSGRPYGPSLFTRSSDVVHEWEEKLVFATPSPGKNFPEKKRRRDVRTGMLVALRWVLGYDVNLVKWLNAYTGTKP
jgi:hypothetical protein